MILSHLRLLVIIFTAFVLTLVHLPFGFEVARPLWGLLVLLYIQFRLPGVFNYLWVIFMGLILDVLSVVPLGEHVFALCIVVGLFSSRARRFKFFTLPQQMIWIFCLALIYQIALSVIDYIGGHPFMLTKMMLPVLMSTLLWPFLTLFMENYLLRIKRR